jgi:hypothetical protein
VARCWVLARRMYPEPTVPTPYLRTRPVQAWLPGSHRQRLESTAQQVLLPAFRPVQGELQHSRRPGRV